MIIDKLKNANIYYGISEKIAKALNFLETTDFSKYKNGKYEIQGEEIFAIVQDYKTKPLSDGKLEAHRKYIDIQYIIKGSEKMGWANIQELSPIIDYNEEKDIIFFNGKCNLLEIPTGFFTIFFLDDAHMPGIEIKKSDYVKKIVVKINI